MIRTVLADDEVLARQKLRQFLKEFEDVDIVGECATASETLELVKLTSPKLLFLDICMPDMDGFDVVNALSSNPDEELPYIVFVTANDRWAVRAFEFHAIDYLLKPFTIERLCAAVQRVRERVAANQTSGGSDIEMKGEYDSKGKSTEWKEIFHVTSATAFTQTLYVGTPGEELKKVSTIVAEKKP